LFGGKFKTVDFGSSYQNITVTVL